MTPLNSALDYASRGWPVFPCKPTNKAPLVEGGFTAATLYPETIKKWWAQWPSAMIGVPMGPRSGAFAIDLDRPKRRASQTASQTGRRCCRNSAPARPRTLTERRPAAVTFSFAGDLIALSATARACSREPASTSGAMAATSSRHHPSAATARPTSWRTSNTSSASPQRQHGSTRSFFHRRLHPHYQSRPDHVFGRRSSRSRARLERLRGWSGL